jgi:hypothetical protein
MDGRIKIPKPVAYVLFSLPWIAAFLVFAYIVIQRFPPSGVFVSEGFFDGSSPWVYPFLPAERASSPGRHPEGWLGQRVFDDPAYFNALVPGPYETVKVTLEYRPVRQTQIEFGLVHDAEGKDLEMRPMFFEGLESAQWTKGSAGGKTGFVRQGTPESRLADPDTRGLATWNATTTMPRLRDPKSDEVTHLLSLRGSHDFYVVPTDELKMVFKLQAANRQKGNDLAAFRVFCGDDEIEQRAFTASGSQESKMGKQFEYAIKISPAEDCIYRISFKASDDVFIRSIQTPSRRWVVGPRLVFGDTVGYSTTTFAGVAWTNSRHIVAETFHKEGLQELVFGPIRPKLKKTHTLVRSDRTDAERVVELKAPQGDVRLVGDGFFAFSPEAFFEPKPRRLTDGTDLESEQIQAVLTDYEKPEALSDGWFRSTFSFRLNPALDRLRFVLSSPGIMARSAGVDVRKATLEFSRPADDFADWFGVLRQELANAWRRL